jgi:hypothetical protein
LAVIILLKRLNIEITGKYNSKYLGFSDPVEWKEIIKEFNIQNSLQERLNMSVSKKLKLFVQGNHAASN